jgi:hypothetical protein
VKQKRFYALLVALHRLNCRYNFWTRGSVSTWLSSTNEDIKVTEQDLDQGLNRSRLHQVATWLTVPGWLSVGLGWQVHRKVFAAGITQHTWQEGDDRRRLDLSVEETIFFPPEGFERGDQREIAFKSFKQLIVEVIRHIEPSVGVIDYEADLLCDQVQQSPYYALPFWGTFLSRHQMARWSKEDIAALRAAVDDYTTVGDLGVLFFIDPLMPDEARTSWQDKVRTLIERNMMAGGESDRDEL